MRYFILSESMLKRIEKRSKPLALEDKKEWEREMIQCRKIMIPEGVDKLVATGLNREGKSFKLNLSLKAEE